MKAQSVDGCTKRSWTKLVGAFVEIRQNQFTVSRGVVEEAMPDSSALWLSADANNQRRMFAAADNYEVWIHPKPLAAPIRFL